MPGCQKLGIILENKMEAIKKCQYIRKNVLLFWYFLKWSWHKKLTFEISLNARNENLIPNGIVYLAGDTT